MSPAFRQHTWDWLRPVRVMQDRIKNLAFGNNPSDREKLWHWLWVTKVNENLLNVLDIALWDLQARVFGLPVYKLFGGCRGKMKAYASTFSIWVLQYGFGGELRGTHRHLQSGRLYSLQDSSLFFLGSQQKEISLIQESQLRHATATEDDWRRIMCPRDYRERRLQSK